MFMFVFLISAFFLCPLLYYRTYPLFFELLAEITYPIPEGTSAGVLTLLTNVFCVVLLGEQIGVLFCILSKH